MATAAVALTGLTAGQPKACAATSSGTAETIHTLSQDGQLKIIAANVHTSVVTATLMFGSLEVPIQLDPQQGFKVIFDDNFYDGSTQVVKIFTSVANKIVYGGKFINDT